MRWEEARPHDKTETFPVKNVHCSSSQTRSCRCCKPGSDFVFGIVNTTADISVRRV